MTAQREDLFSHPTVVAPPAHMDKPSNAHETALAMEMAKHRLAEDSGASTPTASTGVTTPEPDQIPNTDKYAFAFDIDGVLIRGGEVIPEAIDAIKVLNGQNEYGIKVCVLASL
jgi:Haloacid dehalogenase-like hydrolase